MRDNNFQIGGEENKQTVINDKKGKSWQDNLWLYILVALLVGVGILAIAKWLNV